MHLPFYMAAFLVDRLALSQLWCQSAFIWVFFFYLCWISFLFVSVYLHVCLSTSFCLSFGVLSVRVTKIPKVISERRFYWKSEIHIVQDFRNFRFRKTLSITCNRNLSLTWLIDKKHTLYTQCLQQSQNKNHIVHIVLCKAKHIIMCTSYTSCKAHHTEEQIILYFIHEFTC